MSKSDLACTVEIVWVWTGGYLPAATWQAPRGVQHGRRHRILVACDTKDPVGC
jgi:hypothetical protein